MPRRNRPTVQHVLVAPLLAVTLVTTCVSVARASDGAKPLNVVFILADDLGWADTTLYGHTSYHQTPHLERLAKRGMTFTRAYSASPLCSPTRSAILTGLSPARTGITVPNGHVAQVVLRATVGERAPANQKVVAPNAVTRLKTDYRTLAESLRDAGYATGHFGKWHLGTAPYSPLQHGFDVDVPNHPGPGPAGSYVAPWKFKDFSPRSPGEHIEDRMATEAVAWIERQQARPFFLNYWMFSVHAPFDAKREYVDKHRARVNPADAQRSPTYAAMIQSMDDAIGTLLDALDRLELSERTIIIFTSDNGGNMYSDIDGTTPTSNAPLRGGKATMFEGGTRVPAVVVWPGLTKPGSRSDEPIQSEDYYPTLLDGLHIPPAADQTFDGASILPALRGAQLTRDALFQYFPHNPPVPEWLPPSVSVHRGDWKLIRVFHGGNDGAHRHLLFNLRNDISEKHDVAADHPEMVAELDARITRFLNDTKAVTPVPNPDFDPAQHDPSLEGKSRPRRKADSNAPRNSFAPPKTAPAGNNNGDDPALGGWKARACAASIGDGVLRIQKQGPAPFLGLAAGKLTASAQLRFRLRCDGGTGRVAWLPSPQTPAEDAPKPVEYSVKAGEWVEISVKIPAPADSAGIVRLFVPAQDNPVEIDWIELVSGERQRRWDFDGQQPRR